MENVNGLPVVDVSVSADDYGDDPKKLLCALFDHFNAMEGEYAVLVIADEEIEAAQQRRPAAADKLHHSIYLVTWPCYRAMHYEIAYRAHCRELLERVAAGADTQPGTAAEVCCALMETSVNYPLTPAALGLYARMWKAAGLPVLPEINESSKYHEAAVGDLIDEYEQAFRRKFTAPRRQLGDMECDGYHHGEAVDCRYATALGPGE